MAAEAAIAAPPIATEASSYAEHYAIAANDVFGQQYSAAMFHVRAENAAATATTLLRDMASQAPDFPTGCIGMFQTDDGGSLSLVLSGIEMFPPRLGGVSPWTNRVFAFAGDVVSGNIMTVEFPPEGLALASELFTNVPATAARMDELWPQNPDSALLGPFPDGDANIRQVRTRKMMYVPPRYIPLVVGRRLTPRQLWVELVGAIRNNDDEMACSELVNWCMVASIRSVAFMPSHVLQAAVYVPLADPALLAHRLQILQHQVPGAIAVHDPPSQVAQVTANLAHFVSNLVDEHRQTRLDARQRIADTKAPKLPSAFWNEEICRFLCLLCQVPNELALPELWLSLAASGKKDRLTLEGAVYSVALRQGLAEVAPIVTAELTKKIMAVRLAGDDIDDLSEGIQPIALTIPDCTSQARVAEAAAARRQNDEYDILAEGSVSTSLSDAKTLRTTAKITIPTEYIQVKALLQAQDILLQALLGDTHPLCASFRNFLVSYNNSEMFYRGRLEALQISYAPARLLRFIQLRLVNWFREARLTNTCPPPPAFSEVLSNLRLCVISWIPDIPHQYLLPAVPPSLYGGGYSTAPSLADATSTTSTISHSVAPPPSVAPPSVAPSVPSSVPSTPGFRRIQEVHTAFNSAFSSYGRQKLSDAIATAGRPPTITKNGASVEMCVSYHVRGKCWNNCSRAKDHFPHTPAEDALLKTWCDKALPSS